MTNKQQETIREAVGVFDDHDKLQAAIDDLEMSKFERRHISVLGSEKAMKEEFGKSQVATEKLEDNPDAPRSINIAEEDLGTGQGVIVSGGILAGVAAAIVASGGILAPGVITAVIIGGAGGAAVGGVFAKLLGDKYADFFQKQIDEGGLLLWVRTSDKGKEEQATKTLKKNGATDVHVHDIPTN